MEDLINISRFVLEKLILKTEDFDIMEQRFSNHGHGQLVIL